MIRWLPSTYGLPLKSLNFVYSLSVDLILLCYWLGSWQEEAHSIVVYITLVHTFMKSYHQWRLFFNLGDDVGRPQVFTTSCAPSPTRHTKVNLLLYTCQQLRLWNGMLHHIMSYVSIVIHQQVWREARMPEDWRSRSRKHARGDKRRMVIPAHEPACQTARRTDLALALVLSNLPPKQTVWCWSARRCVLKRYTESSFGRRPARWTDPAPCSAPPVLPLEYPTPCCNSILLLVPYPFPPT
jgi:hypothetical protein